MKVPKNSLPPIFRGDQRRLRDREGAGENKRERSEGEMFCNGGREDRFFFVYSKRVYKSKSKGGKRDFFGRMRKREEKEKEGEREREGIHGLGNCNFFLLLLLHAVATACLPLPAC